MRLAVLVPSVGRPADLYRCLSALQRQSVEATVRIVPVVLSTDIETVTMIGTKFPSLQTTEVHQRDVVQSLRAGVALARTWGADLIAFTDDDAEPPASWLAHGVRVLEASPSLAAVGGPDRQPGKDPAAVRTVGRCNFITGRLVGNHHIAWDHSGPVDVLKGVNMLWRSELVTLPDATRGEYAGQGAVPHYEVYMASRAKAQGFGLFFDSKMWTRHYSSPRNVERFSDPYAERYNRLVGLSQASPLWRSLVQVAYSLLVGFRSEPGLARAALLGLNRDPNWRRKWRTANRAALDASRHIWRNRIRSTARPRDMSVSS